MDWRSLILHQCIPTFIFLESMPLIWTICRAGFTFFCSPFLLSVGHFSFLSSDCRSIWEWDQGSQFTCKTNNKHITLTRFIAGHDLLPTSSHTLIHHYNLTTSIEIQHFSTKEIDYSLNLMCFWMNTCIHITRFHSNIWFPQENCFPFLALENVYNVYVSVLLLLYMVYLTLSSLYKERLRPDLPSRYDQIHI
jgi:hypothetical protein